MSAINSLQSALAQFISLPAWLGQRLPSALTSRLRGALGSHSQRGGAAANDYADCALFALRSGELIQLGRQETARELATTDTDLHSVAARAAELTLNPEHTRAVLFLPAEEFVCTLIPLPGVPQAQAPQAIALQAASLIPSLDDALALVQQPSHIAGTDDYLCLWMRQTRLDDYSRCFEVAGLPLAAIAPRAMLAAPATTYAVTSAATPPAPITPTITNHLQDEDDTQLTRVIVRGGNLIKWETLQRCDLDDPELLDQWRAEQTANELANPGSVTTHTTAVWLHQPAAAVSGLAVLASGFVLVPQGERNRRQALVSRRRLQGALIAAAALVVLGLIPLALQSAQFRFAARELHSLRAETEGARQDQAFVADFDRTWGPVSDYPDQRIIDTMFTLQNVISPDRLTSLDINEGVIRIEGTSSNPQAILQRLEQDPLFTEVVFSRATNNSRYTIDLRLSTVSFEGYRVRHLDGDD